MHPSLLSVSLVAQTAFPASVYVAPGSNRRFFLARIGQGTPSGTVAPTLGGQAAAQSAGTANAGMRIDIWIWEEFSLANGSIPVDGGNAAVAAFSESGISDYIWTWGTIKNSDQDVSLTFSSTVDTGSEISTPLSLPITYEEGKPSLILHILALEPVSARLDLKDLDDTIYIAGPVAGTAHVAYVLESVEGDVGRWTHPADPAVTGSIGLLTAVPLVGDWAQADRGKGIPVRRPQVRSIDAKTIADRYNQGQPEQHDYQFRDRKFYQ